MRYIAALDIGTTTVRCHILDECATTVATAYEKVELLYPKPTYVEIDPDQLWNVILKVITEAVKASEIDTRSIICLGIATQRSSCITWNLETGKHYHRFITWKDLRADSMVQEWNSSLTMKGLRIGSHLLYTLTRSKRYLAGSVFKLMNTQVTLRLTWALNHVPGLKEAAENGKAVFGCVDSWLLYKLTGQHVTDVSSASATGLYDPFTMKWASWAMNLFKIPSSMFPTVVDTARKFGNTPVHIFGVPIPITCCMADQAASLLGSGCFGVGDVKLTMGTGTFLNVNTGKEPQASVAGLYPLVGWRIRNELVYMIEGSSNDTGNLLEWTKSLGIIKNAAEMSSLSLSVDNSGGIYFIPAFSGLQAPINDLSAATGFLGLKPTSSKAHMVRSVLESLVFRVVQLYETLCSESRHTYSRIRVDGGVSLNDFMMQLLADLTGLVVERPANPEIAVLGVAFLAGLECGVWKNKEQLHGLKCGGRIFEPNVSRQMEYRPIINQWNRAVERFKNWY